MCNHPTHKFYNRSPAAGCLAELSGLKRTNRKLFFEENARRTLTIAATKRSLKGRIVRTHAARKLRRSTRSAKSAISPTRRSKNNLLRQSPDEEALNYL